MKKFFIATNVCLIILLFASCKKDTNEFVPNDGQQLDSAWTNNVTASSQVLILSKQLEGSFNVHDVNSVVTDTLVNAANAIQFMFPLNGLLLNGVALTGGLKIEYVLLQKKGDFIRYGVTTSASRYPLESGGALHIKLTSNGQPVTVAGNKKISIRYRDTEPKPGMSVFYGSPVTVTNSLLFNWSLATDNAVVKLWDSTNINPLAKGYIIETFQSGWVSAGKSLETVQPRVEVKAVVPNLFSNANTAVYMVFKNNRTVVQLSGNAATRSFAFPNIPVNQEVTFVAISKVGGSYYLGIKEEKTSAATVAFIKPELSSLSGIISYLNSL